jgi:transcriptional regulator with XRE-family HTH domain
MNSRDDIQQFLTSRRAKITPEQAGLQPFGRRRVPGLRREEVAMLAQVSVDYYGRLERGNLKGVSEGVVAALARALQLDEIEERHLRDLIRASSTTIRPAPQRSLQSKISPALGRMLDAMEGLPAVIQNGRLDIVAANRMGRALYFDQFDTPTPPANHARFTFLDPRGRLFAPNWEQAANDIVAILRAEAGRDPHDRQLTDLIGELSTRSDEFRIRWAAHNVHQHKSGSKRIHHRAVGDLILDFQILSLDSDPNLKLVVFSAAPQSPAHDGLQLLSNWAATMEETAGTLARETA